MRSAVGQWRCTSQPSIDVALVENLSDRCEAFAALSASKRTSAAVRLVARDVASSDHDHHQAIGLLEAGTGAGRRIAALAVALTFASRISQPQSLKRHNEAAQMP